MLTPSHYDDPEAWMDYHFPLRPSKEAEEGRDDMRDADAED